MNTQTQEQLNQPVGCFFHQFRVDKTREQRERARGTPRDILRNTQVQINIKLQSLTNNTLKVKYIIGTCLNVVVIKEITIS